MTAPEQNCFVIPGRLEEANPEFQFANNLWIPGPTRCVVPE